MEKIYDEATKQLIAEGHIELVNGEYRLSEKGENEAFRMMCKWTPGDTVVIGLYYANKFGVPLGE